MKKPTILLLFAFALATGTANANNSADRMAEDYFRAAEVTFTEDVPTAAEIMSGYLVPAELPNTFIENLANIDWNAVYLIGQKVIEIVKAGSPVVNINRDAVAVVPMGVTAWQQLSGWQIPVTKVYNFDIKNYLGGRVVSLRLKVSGMWGGSLDGRGQYLANVQVVPVNTRVVWGWNLDLWAENSEPVNAGTFENPIAGLGFDIRYKATTMLNELNGSQDYYLTGDGKIHEL